MNYNVKFGRRSGIIDVPSSKSMAHRFLVCSALAKKRNLLFCDRISRDISATISALNSSGAKIDFLDDECISIDSNSDIKSGLRHLHCGESGTTFRFLLPVAAALGFDAVFHLDGRLSKRPIGALVQALGKHGIKITQNGDVFHSSGILKAGSYVIPGDISSQFVSGLLFALPLLDGCSRLQVTGNIESADYISMTEEVLKKSGIIFFKNGQNYEIPGNQRYEPPERIIIEKDWSGAAFFLCMGALSEKGVTVENMNIDSVQGDKEIINIIRNFGADINVSDGMVTARRRRLIGQTIDASLIPDLIPAVSALAAGAEGVTRIVNAGRLRFKESDRLKTVAEMLNAIGADVEEQPHGLVICGKPRLAGGNVDAANDHRIAMASAVAAGICGRNVNVVGAECVEKSYISFWNDLEKLEVCR